MQAGNAFYRNRDDLPQQVGVFPLRGALLLPGGHLPLNVFEPRYLELIKDAMARDQLIGIIQPLIPLPDDEKEDVIADNIPLRTMGCLGRISGYNETGDGHVIISLQGVCRFHILEEIDSDKPYRQIRFDPLIEDLDDIDHSDEIDREELLATFQAFLENNNMEADWEGIAQATTETLVNALSILAPFGEEEKQALLEASDLKMRADTLIALTEMFLVQSEKPSTLQ